MVKRTRLQEIISRGADSLFSTNTSALHMLAWFLSLVILLIAGSSSKDQSRPSIGSIILLALSFLMFAAGGIPIVVRKEWPGLIPVRGKPAVISESIIIGIIMAIVTKFFGVMKMVNGFPPP